VTEQPAGVPPAETRPGTSSTEARSAAARRAGSATTTRGGRAVGAARTNEKLRGDDRRQARGLAEGGRGAGWRPPPEKGAVGTTRQQGQGAGAPPTRLNAGAVDPLAPEAAGATGGATDTAEAADGDRTT
jgi:hypothetical protein